MPSDKDVGPRGRDVRDPAPNVPRHSARRRLIAMLAGTGLSTAVLPARWTRPVASSVLVPAHAQTSTAGGCSRIRLEMTWSSDTPENGTLVVREPDGTVVGPSETIVSGGTTVLSGVRITGRVLVHLGDAPAGMSGSEQISTIPGARLLPGRYTVGVGFGDGAITLNLLCDGQRVAGAELPGGRQGFSELLEELIHVDIDDGGVVTATRAPSHSIF